GSRVLLGHLCTEGHVLAYGLSEASVVGQTGLVERLEVRRDETLTLLVGDVAMAVNVDQVLEAELPGEPIRTAQRLCREPGQVVDVGWNTLGEHMSKDWIAEGLVVEDLLETVQSFLAPGVLVESFPVGAGGWGGLHLRHVILLV